MDNTMIAILVLILMLALLAIGQPVALAMFTAGVIGIIAIQGFKGLSTVQILLWDSANHPVLVAVPLFILMGEILLHSGLSAKLYHGASAWLRFLPGGLLHANIGACAIFAAISGSSPATAAAIGSVALPELEKRNYDRRITLGSIAAGGTLGILIPPSITLIIYGAMVGESVGQLFIAGIVPGILLVLLFMGYILLRALKNPSIAPDHERVSWKERISVLSGILPVSLLIMVVLGTIYMGIATPTEAAALGVTISLILGLVNRALSWRILKTIFSESLQVICSVLIILVAASIISSTMAFAGLPRQMAMAVSEATLHPYIILLFIYIIYLILGCFFDPMSVLVLTIPILYPVVIAMGFDSVWFGIIVVILIEAGMITPPVGLNLYIIQGIAPKYRFEDIVVGVFPFFLVQLIAIVIITAFPLLATWLPDTMMGK